LQIHQPILETYAEKLYKSSLQKPVAAKGFFNYQYSGLSSGHGLQFVYLAMGAG
jgi:hypothetical protein